MYTWVLKVKEKLGGKVVLRFPKVVRNCHDK